MLRVSLLGDFSISYDDAPVTDIDTPRLQSLLAYLLLHCGAPQSRAYLAFLFWPDTSESQARTNLRNLLHHLRHALPDADAYLDVNVQTLQWRWESPFSLDVADFEDALTKVEQAHNKSNSVAVLEGLKQAVALYQGDLLPSCYDDWIIPQRESLRQAFQDALEQLVGILEEQRDYTAAIQYAQRLLRYDPLHEATYRCLIRLYALNGDRANALRSYHTCTTNLQRELEVEPSAATREAYEQLMGVEALPATTVPTPTAFSALVGRDREWTQMLQIWRTMVTCGPHVVMLAGEAGIGKTRLVEELLQWTSRQGITNASARCYAAEGELAYAPVTAWLRAHPIPPLDDVWLVELARLLPEILAQRPDLPRPLALTEAWQRERLFEALTHAILETNQPVLLSIDDLQWCDRDTLEWLHFLLRFDRQARLLVVGAYRPEEIGENHPLLSLLQALRLDEQVTEIDLQPLDEASIQILATQVAGQEISQETAQLLYRETEGNPFFVVETVRAGLPVLNQRLITDSERKLTYDPLQDDTGLPLKVRSVLQARLAQLSPPARELAELAATIGREFRFKMLVKASGRDEDILVHELDELWQRRIVREHGADAYDFSHDKLREVAYRNLSAARRRRLHHQVAQALETLHSFDMDSVSHQVAVHFELAGLPEQAIPYYLRAAKVARRVYANEEAIALLQHGLALAEDIQPSMGAGECSSDIVAQLWEELGDVLEQLARHKQALLAYHNALSHVSNSDHIRQGRLHRKASVTLREQRLYVEALDACHQAEIAMGEQPKEEDSRWWNEWLEVQVEKVWAYYWLAHWPEMETLVDKVQPILQARGSSVSRMRFLMASTLMHLRRERYVISDKMVADVDEALALSSECGSLTLRVECHFEVGFLHLWRGEFDEAEEALKTALEMTETYGVLPMRTLSLTYLTVLYRFLGQIDVALDYSFRAVEAAEIAHMPDYVAAAKGNLAWIAWRNLDFPTAELQCQEAMTIWQKSPLVYPFQWMALWPLIGLRLAQGCEEEAWEYTLALLEPKQQLLPDVLNNCLEAAVQAKKEGQDELARIHLSQATELAREMGYL
jgi:DNA-binding SARP family transcriptional activator